MAIKDISITAKEAANKVTNVASEIDSREKSIFDPIWAFPFKLIWRIIKFPVKLIWRILRFWGHFTEGW